MRNHRPVAAAHTYTTEYSLWDRNRREHQNSLLSISWEYDGVFSTVAATLENGGRNRPEVGNHIITLTG